jgi:hypothetical protein
MRLFWLFVLSCITLMRNAHDGDELGTQVLVR